MVIVRDDVDGVTAPRARCTRAAGTARGHRPHRLTLSGDGERDTDIGAAEQLDRLLDMKMVAGFDGSEPGDLVLAHAGVTPELENVELDGAVVVPARCGIVAA